MKKVDFKKWMKEHKTELVSFGLLGGVGAAVVISAIVTGKHPEVNSMSTVPFKVKNLGLDWISDTDRNDCELIVWPEDLTVGTFVEKINQLKEVCPEITDETEIGIIDFYMN